MKRINTIKPPTDSRLIQNKNDLGVSKNTNISLLPEPNHEANMTITKAQKANEQKQIEVGI